MAKVSYKFNPFKETDTSIAPDLRDEALSEIKDYVKEKVLDYVGEGKSPVEGWGKFKGYSKEYEKLKKSSSSSKAVNLELTGAMLDSLVVEQVSANTLELTVADEEQEKAEGNNLGTYGHEKPVVEPRRFIPVKGEKLKAEFWTGIREILSKYQG